MRPKEMRVGQVKLPPPPSPSYNTPTKSHSYFILLEDTDYPHCGTNGLLVLDEKLLESKSTKRIGKIPHRKIVALFK